MFVTTECLGYFTSWRYRQTTARSCGSLVLVPARLGSKSRLTNMSIQHALRVAIFIGITSFTSGVLFTVSECLKARPSSQSCKCTKICMWINQFHSYAQCTLGARGFLRGEPRSVICEARSGEERENRQEVRKPLVIRDSWLILPRQ